MQDFRADLSTSPNSPQTPLSQEKLLALLPGPLLWPELSLTEVSAPRWGFLVLQNVLISIPDQGQCVATGSGTQGETQGELWEQGNTRCSSWKLLSALPKPPLAIPTTGRGRKEQEENLWITGRFWWANPKSSCSDPKVLLDLGSLSCQEREGLVPAMELHPQALQERGTDGRGQKGGNAVGKGSRVPLSQPERRIPKLGLLQNPPE